jgi:hypothetical protein
MYGSYGIRHNTTLVTVLWRYTKFPGPVKLARYLSGCGARSEVYLDLTWRRLVRLTKPKMDGLAQLSENCRSDLPKLAEKMAFSWPSSHIQMMLHEEKYLASACLAVGLCAKLASPQSEFHPVKNFAAQSSI